MMSPLVDKTKIFPEYDNVRVVVLGATGFIGRWVARLLTASGARLYLPVRKLSVAQKVFDEFSIQGAKFEFDANDEKKLKSMYRSARPNITFNLAGYGVDREQQNEVTAYRVNVNLIGSICLAISETADKSWNGSDIVHAGSAMEYGSAGGNLSEDSIPQPTTLYGRSKLAGTKLLAKACRELHIKGRTARLFSVYGPGEPAWRLLPSLVPSAEDAKSIQLTAGTHQRDFTYVEDVAEALLRLGLASDSGEVVNVATGELNTVRSFVETAAEILNIQPDLLRFGELPIRAEEMVHEPVSVGRLRSLIRWIPDTRMASGIQKTIEFQSLARSMGSGRIAYARTGVAK